MLWQAWNTPAVQAAWQRMWRNRGIACIAAMSPIMIYAQVVDWPMWKTFLLAGPPGFVAMIIASSYYKKSLVSVLREAIVSAGPEMAPGAEPPRQS